MASPQTENGYTRIANELLEALCRARLSGVQFAVVMWVARMSYGWHARKTKPLGLRSMARDIKIHQASVCWAVNKMLENRVLLLDETGCFSINKNYEAWLSTLSTELSTAQPIRQKVPNPLGTLPNPLGTLPNPLGKSAQPIRQFHDGPKERKKVKESVKGEIAQNGDTHTPTLDEITAYAAQIGKAMDCGRFFDHYAANGWTRGKSRIADWKAVVRLWENEGPIVAAPTARPHPDACEHCAQAVPVFRTKAFTWACKPCYVEREGRLPNEPVKKG